MGTVDANNRLNFYAGKTRMAPTERNSPSTTPDYCKHIAERASPGPT